MDEVWSCFFAVEESAAFGVDCLSASADFALAWRSSDSAWAAACWASPFASVFSAEEVLAEPFEEAPSPPFVSPGR